jgi:hypothetical protein
LKRDPIRAILFLFAASALIGVTFQRPRAQGAGASPPSLEDTFQGTIRPLLERN